jgi:hypothetical protein
MLSLKTNLSKYNASKKYYSKKSSSKFNKSVSHKENNTKFQTETSKLCSGISEKIAKISDLVSSEKDYVISSFNVSTNQDNENVIPIDTSKLFVAISELEDKFSIKLQGFPYVIAVGTQSSGKSSVIEAICGESILPKSMKMSTLKPIHLTTIRSPVRKFKVSDREVYTTEDATREIERLNNNSMVTKVNVTIWSPDVYNANLIDLPGLFVVETAETAGMSKLIKNLNTTYLQDPNNIPVIVHAGPSDPATDQGLKLIGKLQRNKDSLGIITKVDMLEQQKMSFVEDMLNGKSYPLGHKYCAVILRNDKDIEAELSINDKIKIESEFFSRFNLNPSGVSTMRKIISDIQFSKIKHHLPRLLTDIDSQIDNLKVSQSFMYNLINNNQKVLASKLRMMIEKLVGSSLERANFEEKLKNEFKLVIGKHLNDTYCDVYDRPEVSNKNASSDILEYHNNNKSDPKAYKSDGIKELFSYGLVSPIFIDNKIITNIFQNEATFAASIPMFEIFIDDPLSKKRMEWNRSLNTYFAKLLQDDKIHKTIHDITEKLLLEYIYNDPEGCDDITRKFAEYMIIEIGNQAYESNIKYSITATLNLERRPQVSIFEIARYITQMYPKYFTFDGSFTESLFRDGRKIKLEVYGKEWNEAYLRVVGDKLTENSYRNVAVNLLDRMVEKLLELCMDLFNKENAVKEQTKINEKAMKLGEIRTIIASYSSNKNRE